MFIKIWKVDLARRHPNKETDLPISVVYDAFQVISRLLIAEVKGHARKMKPHKNSQKKSKCSEC